MELKYMTTWLALYLFNYYQNTAVDIANNIDEIEQDDYFIYDEGKEKYHDMLHDHLEIVNKDIGVIVNYLRSVRVPEVLAEILSEGPEDCEFIVENLRNHGINLVDHI